MTSSCTFFDPTTSVITQVAVLSDETLEHYVNAGANALLDIIGNPETQYVAKDADDNWALVDYTADELNAKNSMVPGQKWLMPDKIVITDPDVSLDSLKAKKDNEINLHRETANQSFTYLSKTIRRLPLDESDINGTNGYVALFGVFPDNWPGGWKAEDNTYVAITTTDDWKAFYKAMVDQGNANFHHAQDLKTQLANATTPEQVAAIVW